jgi:hypothetical protein
VVHAGLHALQRVREAITSMHNSVLWPWTPWSIVIEPGAKKSTAALSACICLVPRCIWRPNTSL